MNICENDDLCPCDSGKKFTQCCMRIVTSHSNPVPAAPVSTLGALALALEHYKLGQLQEAESMCHNILRMKPNSPYALHVLAAIAYQSGKHQLAVDYIKTAMCASQADQLRDLDL